MHKSVPAHFNCPNCDALYQLVKTEAGPKTFDRWVTCRACGGPLRAREGEFVLKYFLLREAARRRKYARRPPDARGVIGITRGWKDCDPGVL